MSTEAAGALAALLTAAVINLGDLSKLYHTAVMCWRVCVCVCVYLCIYVLVRVRVLVYVLVRVLVYVFVRVLVYVLVLMGLLV